MNHPKSLLSRTFRAVVVFSVILVLIPFVALAAAPEDAASTPAREFSFVHLSDIHVSPAFDMPTDFQKLRSFACVSTLKDLGSVALEPYGIAAPKPSFAIATGDIAEFSFPGVTWEVVDRYFEGFPGRVYMVPGNHDNTWVATPGEFRKRFGGLNYSFDTHGCHFIGLCDSTLQDPVPSFGEEVVQFLERDLEKVGPTTPVFVFFHHPLNGGEFASRFDVDRILDVMRPYNIVLTLDGHGHSAVRHDFYQLDGIEGGSPFSRNPGSEGYNIVYVHGDRLMAAYRKCSEEAATKGLIERRIPERSTYPDIAIQSPASGSKVGGAELNIEATIKGFSGEIAAARYSLDDDMKGDLKYGNGKASGGVDVSGLLTGAHFLRVEFVEADGGEFTRSVAFYVEPSEGKVGAKALWRQPLGGASKATPLIMDGTVYLGANDGKFHAVDAKTGAVKWTFDAGGEILTSAATLDGLVFFGAADGRFHALNTDGKEVWSYGTDAAIFSSPVVDAGTKSIYFGTNAARLVALNAKDGKPLWVNSDARFSVESKPFLQGGKVYYGAWDGYVYCVDAKTGTTLWKKPGPKNQARVITYYGPADDGPAVAPDGKVFICDRGYVAGRYSPAGDYEKTIAESVSALSLSADGKALYLRGLKEPLSKVDLDGTPIWKSSAHAGRIPVGPTVRDGKVYICSNTGRLTCLDDKTGATLWEYQVTPQLFVMAGLAVEKGIVYAVGMDGVLTSIAPAD